MRGDYGDYEARGSRRSVDLRRKGGRREERRSLRSLVFSFLMTCGDLIHRRCPTGSVGAAQRIGSHGGRSPLDMQRPIPEAGAVDLLLLLASFFRRCVTLCALCLLLVLGGCAER